MVKTLSVSAYMAALQHPLRAEIEALRALIQGLDPGIQESIKWNAPSFALGEHFATLKLRPETRVQIVLHTGAKLRQPPVALQINDPAGLLDWAAPDRALLSFENLAQIEAQRCEVEALLRQWLAQVAAL
ncbi:MAG: DUF1801 domain-containing protein [Candidatus Sericytochromatia bacterium]